MTSSRSNGIVPSDSTELTEISVPIDHSRYKNPQDQPQPEPDEIGTHAHCDESSTRDHTHVKSQLQRAFVFEFNCIPKRPVSVSHDTKAHDQIAFSQ